MKDELLCFIYINAGITLKITRRKTSFGNTVSTLFHHQSTIDVKIKTSERIGIFVGERNREWQ